MMRTKLTSSLSVVACLIFTAATGERVVAQSPTPPASRTRPRKAAPVASAQNPAQTPADVGENRGGKASQSPRLSTAAIENADLSITARVTARELRFKKVPNPTVEFTGQPRRDTVWEAERENLPAQVRPGETYRNIGITLRITSVFADIERIVAEALGEIPAREDSPPPPREPPTQQPAQPPDQQTRQSPSTSPAPAHTSPTAVTRPNSVNPPRGVATRKRGGK